jgi:hypothetical protein
VPKWPHLQFSPSIWNLLIILPSSHTPYKASRGSGQGYDILLIPVFAEFEVIKVGENH